MILLRSPIMEQFEITPWFAHVFYQFQKSLLKSFALSPRDSMALAYFLVLLTLMTVLFFAYRKKYRIIPSPIQQAIEGYYRIIHTLCVEMIGHEKGEHYVSIIGTIGLFIWFANLLGFIPGFISPTSNINVTAGAAIFVFLFYHWQGIRDHGLWGYIKHFAGPIWWLTPLFFPLEIISHFARPVSLSLRLFGNIFGEDLVIVILFLMIFPILVPFPVMILAIITSTIQALVFVMLSITYIAGAVGESH